MKKIVCCIFYLGFLGLLLGNGLQNGGFEQPSSRKKEKTWLLPLAEHWTSVLKSGRKKVGAELSEDARQGRYSMKLYTLQAGGNVSVDQEIACEPDSEMTASAWLKSGRQGNAKAYFRVYFKNEKGEITNRKYDVRYMPGWVVKNHWTLCEAKFRIPRDVHRMVFSIQTLGNRESEVELFIDEVKLSYQSLPVLKNRLIRAEINPLFGGCIDQLEFMGKKGSIEFTLPRYTNYKGGMALEIIPDGKIPGYFSGRPYQVKILQPHEKIAVERTQQSGELKGLQIRKIYHLEPDTARLKVSLEFRNGSSLVLPVSCRVHHVLLPLDGYFTSPTRDWMQCFHRTGEIIKTRNVFESNNLKLGWLAKSMKDSSVVFCFDNSRVKNGYSWMGEKLDTIEWSYTPFRLAPGESRLCAYEIHLTGSGEPVIHCGSDRVFGIDTLEDGKMSRLRITAQKKLTLSGRISSGRVSAELSAGGSHEVQLSAPEVSYSDQSEQVLFGARHKYKAEMMRGIRLPPPLEGKAVHDFDHFFPVMFNDVAFVSEESTGIKGASLTEMLVRHGENTIRECAENYLNTFFVAKLTRKKTLDHMQLPDGRNNLGEQLKKYDLCLLNNSLVYGRKDLDPKQFQKSLKQKLALYFPENHLRFMQQYRDRYKAVITADEPVGQNIPCMIAAHNALDELLPDMPVFPLVNLHSRVFIPYVPVFFADWYPINRPKYGGRNPWSVAAETRETVKAAGDKPVLMDLQCFGYFSYGSIIKGEGYAFPTAADLRMMIHLAAANGAKGLNIYEMNNRGIIWRYKFGYHYTARGNAGELTPLWQVIGEGARELTAIGPQLNCSVPVPCPEWAKIHSEIYSSANGLYKGRQVQLYALKRSAARGGGYILVAVNNSERSRGEAVLSLSSSDSLYSLSRMEKIRNAGKYHISLRPGDAEYFAAGPLPLLERIADEVALERCRRKKVVLAIRSARAEGNGVVLEKSAKLLKESIRLAEQKKGLPALDKMLRAEEVLKQETAASPFGRFDAQWRELRSNLSEISFLFLTHFDLVIPPHLRDRTPKFAKWKNTDDPQMQKMVDQVADAWTEYWRIEHAIVHGHWTQEKEAAEKLVRDGNAAAQKATAYLRAKAAKIMVDNPYE